MSRIPQADFHLLGGPHQLLLLLQFKLFKRCNDTVGPLIVTERSRSLTWPVPSIPTSEAKALEQLQIVPYSRQGFSGEGLRLREPCNKFMQICNIARYLRQATETWGYRNHTQSPRAFRYSADSGGIFLQAILEWRCEEHHHRSDLDSHGQLLKLVRAIVCLHVCVIEDRLACSYEENPVENIVQFYGGWILRQNAWYSCTRLRLAVLLASVWLNRKASSLAAR